MTFRARRCRPAIWLDGVRMPPGFGGIDDLVMPEDVEGIEVYSGDLATPMEFWGGCGANRRVDALNTGRRV